MNALLALQRFLGSQATLGRFGLAGCQLQDRIVGFDSRLVFSLFKVLGRVLQPLGNLAPMLKLPLRLNAHFLEERVIRL